MPNIHIHTTDDHVAGELVALILAACGSRIRITVDNSDIHDVGGSIAARAATETGRRLILDIEAAERERRRETELAKAAFYATQDADYDHNLSVACPHCQAPAGQACVRPNGDDHKRPYVHSVRRRDANIAATEPPKVRVAAYCVCSHEREAHKGLGRDGHIVTAEPGDHPCEAEACSCSHYTTVLPTAVAIPLDEM